MIDTLHIPGALVIGAGPAGLRAAEVLAAAGHPVTVADAMPRPGRKILVAGKGGLNLTHSEPLSEFLTRFLGGGAVRWSSLLSDFGPSQVVAWCEDLGVPTYIGTSGRVFPEGDQAAKLLRSWIARLTAAGVTFLHRHRFEGFSEEGAVRLTSPEGPLLAVAPALVLALGGASWPTTGSDGTWVAPLQAAGFRIQDLVASNCGYEVDWSSEFLERAEGRPLKNLAVRFQGHSVRGELLVTRYGLEGGALYQLSSKLRGFLPATIEIDLKPDVPLEGLLARLAKFRGKGSVRRKAGVCWRLGPAGKALFATAPGETAADFAAWAKAAPVTLVRTRPVAEAISTAGGIGWDQLSQDLEVTARPGVFVAGEMLDWDAPTGGYLLTGCLATGERAGRGAVRRLEALPSSVT